MLHGPIGLAQVGAFLESFFFSFAVSLVAITTVTAAKTLSVAARARGLLAATRLARAAFSLSHDSPRSLRSLAQ
jgi:hypothetical protein